MNVTSYEFEDIIFETSQFSIPIPLPIPNQYRNSLWKWRRVRAIL